MPEFEPSLSERTRDALAPAFGDGTGRLVLRALDGVLVALDEGLVALLGREPAQLLGRSALDLRLAAIGEPLGSNDGRLPRHGTRFVETRQADGEAYVVLELLALSEAGDDEANRRLLRSAEKFYALFQHSTTPAWVMRPEIEGHSEVNQAALDIFGLDDAELRTARREDVWVQPVTEEVRAALRTSDRIEGLEAVVRHSSGREIPVIVSARVIEIEGHDCVLVHLTDISAVKAAEAERAEIANAMRETQKLESLGLLAGGIAHDFNNLLAGVVGNAELALLADDLPSEATERIENITRAAGRAADLTRQMLAYSGRGRFVVEPVDVAALITEMGELLAVTIPKHQELRIDLPDDLPMVEADATQIRQVVMNLIINASEAIDHEHGVINVRAGIRPSDAGPPAAPGFAADLPPGEYVWFEVGDNGRGIDAAILGNIFEPFFTTKATGRGLGMSVIQGIVRGHGGVMAVESEPGRGTAMRVLLPALPDDVGAHAREGDREPDATVPLSGTVMVVDDEAELREVAKRVLAREGLDVVLAEDGRAALERFADHADEIVLVLLDLSMPRMGGEDTFRALRRMRPELPILLMSGYDEHGATRNFADEGLAGFLAKPFPIEALRRNVHDLLDGSSGPGRRSE